MKRQLATLVAASAFVLALNMAGLFQLRVIADDKPSAPQDAQAASTIRLRVLVEDTTGKPLPNAKGVLYRLTPPRGQAARRDAEPTITKTGTVPTSKDARLETRALPVKASYVLEVQADGFAPALSRWTHVDQAGTIELPPVRLRRLGTISGMVVDRQGHAVPSVTVIQAGEGAKRLESVTDREGKFRLGSVPEGRAIVCFESAGFRFHGTLLASPSEGARVELERTGDTNPRVLNVAAAPGTQWSTEQRTALVKKILDPLITRVLAQPIIAERDQAILAAAARLQPDRVLPKLDTLKFARPYMANSVRFSLGYGLLNDGKPDAALEAIGKFKDSQSRAQAYLYWFSREPAKTKYPEAHRVALARAREILDKAKPADNMYLFCELGAQLSELGDRAGAQKVFQECERLIDKVLPENYSRDAVRMQLAIAVSRDDLERAKKLTPNAEPNQRIRLASEIARHHPKEIESLLADVPGELSLMELRGVANSLPNLCLRVARQDAAAAERLLLKYARVPQPKTDAERMFGLGGSFGLNLTKEFIEFQVAKLKAMCYAVIAEAALAHDPTAARHALNESIELVKPMREGFLYPMSQDYHGPAVLMALLVPVTERIDPALARELFWRALSLRVSASAELRDREKFDIDTCLLANLVRYYDREIAESLLEPILERARSRTFAGVTPYYWFTRSLTLDSPERALAWSDSLCELPSLDGALQREITKQVIANVLSSNSKAEGDRRQSLESELASVRGAYGVYVDRD
jgi:hypothetical protein